MFMKENLFVIWQKDAGPFPEPPRDKTRDYQRAVNCRG